jgi:dihydroneopterin aldolase/2-amino-4-hydroxy-6-hydroxymethyldihydropteridine diphosphokinase
MFKILIKNLNLFGYHGVKEIEKKNGQNFLFNIEISLNKGSFFKSDNLEDTLNYSEVIKVLKEINGSRKFNLLETLSMTIADRIMEISPLVNKISVKIEKTSPPIKENLESVGVKYVLERTDDKRKKPKADKIDVYLSLGSNMGSREGNLRKALDIIKSNPSIDVIGVSSIYETEPMYIKDQDYFYNIVLYCCVDERLGPFETMGFLKDIEYSLGRRKMEKRYGPRIIDIDLLYYGKLILQSDFLTIPHPKIMERKFVLLPLREIAPDFKIEGESIREFVKRKRLTGKVTLVKSW